ncbi:NAD(P)H-hydrate dehydratase [Clostridium beijerinckii]|uniref:Bifunctional NAD(P)H-hydrate repair enzyme n=1 Tax=Clostridium beijerinckii TaxID=1520 RepID=A0A1S9NAP8_CLOBE|nr:NAD(P)H-hydrate dehydratase [Clostridium beijerinckii]MZK49633.1 NAD(P)H-hydrate dehydratase [Clostridium beijerinckii]MZK58358.1 NAD(P)H-hydrate dehydratase [Clostridium beijerinckii]MZK68216.1 NAD(P)H-hydrate dehydratase [Clostridium beijerinckii]MZK73301.1 NAD(P)H-hydrate dehydratase [Clostridium beijerinckii]MZK83287.1 NAD(P)H-hydrate dehydratase [Clostridium beijerinckii]
MLEIFSAKQCREMDRKCIDYIGIPSIVLMENAAISLFGELSDKGESFLILCGKGNNGGDALALARHLILDGKKVRVYIVSKDENYSQDFKINFNILEKIIEKRDILFIKSENDIDENVIRDIKDYDLLIDGIFGVGLNKDLMGMFKSIIECINLYAKFVVSIDTPSGLDCDLGIERGIAVHANITYTFEVIKQGFLDYKAIDCVGKIKMLKIGIPEYIKKKNSNNFYILEKKEYNKMLLKRQVYGHKGDYGRAVVVAGRIGFTGAAFITTECTVRAGAGLTTLVCSSEVQRILSSRLTEAMTLDCEDNDNFIELIKRASSIAFGPGIGVGEREKSLLEKIINNSKCPIVIDADGISIIGENKYLLNDLKGRAIITPHPGEMARFLGMSIEDVEANRVSIAKSVAKRYGIIVLLKGYNTVISNGKEVYINPTGNSKMASGGMGDALTGIINAFLSQGASINQAALLSAYIHGNIADKLSKQVYIVNARDIIAELPKEINSIID